MGACFELVWGRFGGPLDALFVKSSALENLEAGGSKNHQNRCEKGLRVLPGKRGGEAVRP